MTKTYTATDPFRTFGLILWSRIGLGRGDPVKISALKVLATAAFAAIVASPVSAADMAVKAPPPIVEVWNWTGFYIGGNAG
jgi:hypothetical protein